MIFECKISKIPCYVQAIKRGEDTSFVVYDRRGYAANWLEKKLTEDEYFDIMEKVNKELENAE